MKLLCKWFGHKQPCDNQTGWYSPGEQYVTMRGSVTDGIQRIHVDLWAECERCGTKYRLARSHVNNEAMLESYKIIKYQMGRLGENLSKKLDRLDDVPTTDVYDPQGELWRVRFEQQRDKMIKAGLIDG